MRHIRTNPPVRVRTAAAGLAVGLALSGCSGGDTEAKEDCFRDAYNAAEARAVVRLYEEGQLGTQRQIESEMTGPPGGGARSSITKVI
jgi:hypothetical protein